MGAKRKARPGGSGSTVLAGWDPRVKDPEVEVYNDPLTGGYYQVSCASTTRAWIGVRGRPGIVSGAYCFEVKVIEGLLRVGWASSTGSLRLGTDAEGFGYGGTGKKSHRNKFADYGLPFESGDIITCCIDRARREISFGVNNTWHGRAFAIPSNWDGVALFPALCAREAFKATGYFGCPDHPKVPHGCGYWPLGAAHDFDIVESDSGPPPPPELPMVEEPASKRQDRAERFTKLARVDQDLTKLASFTPACAVAAEPGGPLVGQSRALERGYLRDAEKLRDPAHIRPIPVLKEALAHAMKAKRPWAWEAEMLRAIRQDLTVQHAGEGFREEVNEVSASRALANSDWPTFAVCAPAVGSRPRAAEFSWLLLLGSKPLAQALSLQCPTDPESETAKYVRTVLADVSIGRWTRVLQRIPPTESAGQAFETILRPLVLARAFAAVTKAFPKIRVDTLRRLGIDDLPAGVHLSHGVVDGRAAHSIALAQVEIAHKPTQRDDHSAEFLR